MIECWEIDIVGLLICSYIQNCVACKHNNFICHCIRTIEWECINMLQVAKSTLDLDCVKSILSEYP